MRVLAACGWLAVLCLVPHGFSRAQGTLRVDEARVLFELKTDAAVVELPVENASPGPVSARLRLEMVDPRGTVRGAAEEHRSYPSGWTKARIPLSPLPSLDADRRELVWYRLRYSLVPDTGGVPPVEGVLSVGETLKELFELRAAGPGVVRGGGRYAVRVRATHPVTGRPVPGVLVEASLDVDAQDGKPLVTRARATDRQGFAALEFTLPRSVPTDRISVTLTGKLGGFTAEADDRFQVDRFLRLSLTTDKPIYQPGQTLHARLLAFGADRKALAGESVILKIFDPDDTLVYRTELQSSAFGIAAADWAIPDNLRLGAYRIEAAVDEGSNEEAVSKRVQIRRYDLPSFTVLAKPDRAYYLPDQNASIEIRADYLFGEPVRNGRVRVVRESERQWNYREQKWQVEEGESYEGQSDDAGRYLAQVDLGQEHRKLASDEGQRFRDLTYAAYFTDASTGRTEQRRFDLRLSRDPIHLYVIEPNNARVAGLPYEFYLSADYADGSPAECAVDIDWVAETGPPAPVEQFLRRVRTNRYGLAKVRGLSLPARVERGDITLRLRARDGRGRVGRQTASTGDLDRPGIRVETGKALYRTGETVEVELLAGDADFPVVVEAVRDSEVLASRLVRVRHGRATAVFESAAGFENEVTFVAYALERTEDGGGGPSGSRTVLFPRDHELKVDVRLRKGSYRPGEEAAADFRVTAADGAEAKSAIGLVVVDKAVEERERTDRGFGKPGASFLDLEELTSGAELNGVRRADLNKLDLTKPVPAGLDLVTEALLAGTRAWPETFSSGGPEASLAKLFQSEIEARVRPIESLLDRRYRDDGEYPSNEDSLDRLLASLGYRLGEVRDPWGVPYRPRFAVVRESQTLEILSAGPDKRFGTGDDFVVSKRSWPYFRPVQQAIERALAAYHARTGDFLADAETLRGELLRLGVDLGSLRDPWGQEVRLRFGVNRERYTVTVWSAGPDGRFDTRAAPSHDDFSLATVGIDYFSDERARIDRALTGWFQEAHRFPETANQLQTALASAGIESAWKDPWGRPYYASFRQESRYADELRVETYAEHQSPRRRTIAVPVSRQINWVYLRSAGEDGVEGTSDDFDLAVFSRAVMEEASRDPHPEAASEDPVLRGAAGAISGTVTDAMEAAIAGTVVSAKNQSGETFTARTDDAGAYLLANLPAGAYNVQFSAFGFASCLIIDVPVRSSLTTRLDARLAVGTVNSRIEVNAQAVALDTEAASVSAVAVPQQRSTPRLREYFPETLVWQPEIVTDASGRAQVRFPLGDSITTWRLEAVASTVEGNVGAAEKELRAFQPFFLEHDPPRFLTVGDEIALPVVLRNYLDRRLDADLEMKPAAWFTPLGPTNVRTSVSPRASSSGSFRLRAVAAASDGRQQVSAVAKGAGDAVSKPVEVRPNGEERVESVSRVFQGSASLELAIPDEVLPGSVETTLKLYPNLTAHLLEGIEAVLERPHGCGEQTISSAYPSLLFLKYARGGVHEKSPTAARARRYAALGYQRLLSYRAPDGGFSYWGRGSADLALTVYALRFLGDAREFVAVDDLVIEESLAWVLRQAQADGRWRDESGRTEDAKRSALLTAYVARTLADSSLVAGRGVRAETAEAAKAALNRAVAYLAPQARSLDEPYLLASYALAVLGAGDARAFSEAVESLKRLEHREGDASYWSLETNTPFYGWGRTGRVETTALAVEALSKAERSEEAESLASRGLLFLIRSQDRFGVWNSTQATIQVLDAMASLAFEKERRRPESAGGGKAVVRVDGKEAASVDLPAADVLSGPLLVRLSPFVSAGRHRIEIAAGAGSSTASLQLVADYYVPWTRAGGRRGASEALRLAVHFDKQALKAGEPVECTVEAERVGFRGYGMLLGEIGLPPGADVDRRSLATAMQTQGAEIDHYELLPDRLVVYLWPKAGGSKFSFRFRPRFGLRALTAPSSVYDYYNPEARAVLEPQLFTVE